MINFTKQYEQNFIIDERGNAGTEENVPGHKVIYEGRFDKKTNHFVGEWEIVRDLAHTPNLTLEEVATGKWRMRRHD